MPTTPPRLLFLTAGALGTGLGRALSRRSFLSLFQRSFPSGSVESIAARMPDAGTHEPASAFLDERTIAPLGSGPLSGSRVAVKDSLDVGGLATGLGLPDDALDDEHRSVDRDATIVERMRRAGATVHGKARMTELGMDGIGALMPGAMIANPVCAGYIPGGSSTGTAVAVASGTVRFGIGGDGLGSVRIPAAFHGLVGLKPGSGALPLEGYRSVAPSMDVPGPIARDVADCALSYQVISGSPVEVVTPKAPRAVGFIAGLGPELACADQQRALARILDAVGVGRRIVTVAGAAEHHALAVAASTAELATSAYADRTRSGQGLVNVALGRAIAGESVTLTSLRAKLREGMLRALDSVDAIAMPTTAVPPPALTHGLRAGGQDLMLLRAIGAYTPLANLTGLPAITVPSGVDGRGRPLAIMLMGRPGGELELLAFAAALEATGLGRAPI